MNAHLSKPIRVRMAPSPTGNLHIGTARTALFNLLFAKNQGGTFVLRFEDTDQERSTKESEKDIVDGLAWLGITFDEGVMSDGSEKGEYGPYRQMACLDSYETYLQTLLKENKAYYCFCTKEELEEQRISQETSGQVPKYSGKCRAISHEEAATRLSKGESAVIRIKVPATGTKKFTDLIRGEVEFDLALMGDMVIAKGLRAPLYNFAVVVDDHAMKISHVIRGDDHLANTPKQLVIADALGFHSPVFAHLPIILSATGKGKMSKRDGGTAIREYRDAGYLPEAMINFLALLGWHPTGDQEIFSLTELAAQFSIDRVQKAGAKFNKEKLNWFNNHYIRQMDSTKLLTLLKQTHLKKLLDTLRLEGVTIPADEQLLKIIALTKERVQTLAEFPNLIAFFLKLPPYEPSLLVWKNGTAEGAKENLKLAKGILEQIPENEFFRTRLEAALGALAEKKGKGDVLWPLRVALSGATYSPGPHEIMEILGKHENLLRIEFALAKLEQNG